MKTKILLVSIIIIIGLFVFSKPFFQTFRNTDTIINKIGCRIFELNTIAVKAGENVDLNSILLKHNSRTVYKKGRQKSKIRIDYGYCTFHIFYNNILISEIGHFKTNNWYTNDYYLTLSKSDEGIKVGFKIDGPSNKYAAFKKQYKRDKSNEVLKIEYYNDKDSLYNVEIVK